MLLSALPNASAVDAAALQARLQSLSSLPTTGPSILPLSPPLSSTASTTPPPDPEEDSRLEQEARNVLERDGCPPYYPYDSSYYLEKNSPEKYEGINLYWDTYACGEGGVLCTQLQDWRNFRSYQERHRRYYIRRFDFDRYLEIARERRRRHRLVPEVRFHRNPKEQTRLETWVEFQNYHLHYQEEFEKRVEVETQGLRTAERDLKGAVEHKLDRARSEKSAYSYRLARATEKMELHKKHILPWIEQQRIDMVATANEISDSHKLSTSNTRKRKPEIRSVLKPIRSAVTKPAQRRRSPRIQQSKPSPISEDPTSSHVYPQNTKSPMLHVRKSKRQKTKEEAPLRPLHPHKVTKPIQKSRKPTRRHEKDTQINREIQSRSNHGRRPPRSRSAQQHVIEGYVTKSGRTLRRRGLCGFIS